MGFFSSLKNKLKKLAKKIWHSVKAVVRVIVRLIITAVAAIVPGIYDLLLGWLAWPPKKLRLQILILSDESGPVMSPNDPDLKASIEFAQKTLKDRFNIELRSYSRQLVQVIEEQAPDAALNVGCGAGGVKGEFGEAGEFFANHMAGWNAIPISLNFPITAFIVQDVKGTKGCSLGPLTDYLTLDVDGPAVPSTLVHEIGHVCNLWHSHSRKNLMYHNDDRGDEVKWFQKNLVRSSRHVQYW
jgi:hypothetical protein